MISSIILKHGHSMHYALCFLPPCKPLKKVFIFHTLWQKLAIIYPYLVLMLALTFAPCELTFALCLLCFPPFNWYKHSTSYETVLIYSIIDTCIYYNIDTMYTIRICRHAHTRTLLCMHAHTETHTNWFEFLCTHTYTSSYKTYSLYILVTLCALRNLSF